MTQQLSGWLYLYCGGHVVKLYMYMYFIVKYVFVFVYMYLYLYFIVKYDTAIIWLVVPIIVCDSLSCDSLYDSLSCDSRC